MIERDEVSRIKTERVPGTLGRVLTVIGRFGAQVGEIATLHGSLLLDPLDRDVHRVVAGSVTAAVRTDS